MRGLALGTNRVRAGLGKDTNTVRELLTAGARGREKLSLSSSSQEPGEGPQQRNSRVRARLGKDTNTVRELPTAGARACAAG